MWAIIVDLYNRVCALGAALIDSGYAALLVRLDAAITSRAPAATALTNATWTDALAGALTTLGASSVLSTCVNSIQTGYVNVDAATWQNGTGENVAYTDLTITAVNVAKSIVLFQGGTLNGYPAGVTAHLQGTTTLRCSIQDTATPAVIRGRWTVLELK